MMRILALFCSISFLAVAQHGINPIPIGPMHREGNRIVDSAGQTIVLRGAEIPGLNLGAPNADTLALSPTTFSTMRQRFNMNALRLPVVSSIAAGDPLYLTRAAEIVREAKQAGLVVILAEYGTGMPTPEEIGFWHTYASYFKNNPMVIFDMFNEPDAAMVPGHVSGIHSPADWQFWLHGGIATNGQPIAGMQALVDAIRSAGATQMIAVMGFNDDPEMQGFDERAYIPDANIMYEVHPFYVNDLTNDQRDAHFGFLANTFPLLAGEWGFIPGEDSANCRDLPNDPAQVEQVIEDTMAYFEAHQMSWTIATFLPGNLYVDFTDYYRTDLISSWTCSGEAQTGLGIGEPVNYYLDGIAEGDMVPVSGAAGNVMALARGSVVHMYGPGMADTTETATSIPPPLSLSGISVQITDSKGAIFLAGLRYVSPYLINLVLPPDVALGTASFVILGGSGAGLKGHGFIQDVSPGLFTGPANGRGPVVATALEPDSTLPVWQCNGFDCQTVPVPIPNDASVVIQVNAAGIRNTTSLEHVSATIGGIPVPVIYAGVQGDASQGIDEVDLRLFTQFRGLGETDLIVTVDGQVSNAVRINIQ